MAIEVSTLIGAAASIASVSSFGPQAWKIVRTRDTSSLSSAMYALTVLGFALWLSYGIVLGQWPLILTNGICLALAGFILAMKLMPASGKEEVAEAIESSLPIPDSH